MINADMKSRIKELETRNKDLEFAYEAHINDIAIKDAKINELQSKMTDIQHQLDAAINELCEKKSIIRSLQNELSLYNEQYLR